MTMASDAEKATTVDASRNLTTSPCPTSTTISTSNSDPPDLAVEASETKSNAPTNNFVDGSRAVTNASSSSSFSSNTDWEGLLFKYKRKLEEMAPHLLVAAICVIVSLILTGNVWILKNLVLIPLIHLLLRIIGVALGVGLGLGLAAHVYDQLQEWHLRHHDQLQQQRLFASSMSSLPPVDGVSASEQAPFGVSNNMSMSLPPPSSRRPSSLRRYYSGSNVAGSTKSVASHSLSNVASGVSTSNLMSSSMGGASMSLLRQPQQQQRWDQDESPYVLFMTSAGYQVGANQPNRFYPTPRSGALLRGQILRQGSNHMGGGATADTDSSLSFLQQQQKVHRFTDIQPPEQQYGVQVMEEEWPLLPAPIRLQLGRWIEHILRDYISSWYSMLDSGCEYQDERTKREKQQQAKRQQQQPTNATTENKDMSSTTSSKRENRVMVLSTTGLRPCPPIEILYHTIAICLGNLAMRVEGINVMELILLKWTKVLAHTFKVYRLLRKSVVAKTLAHSHHHAASSSTMQNTSAGGHDPMPQLQQQLQPQMSANGLNNMNAADGSATTSSRNVAVSEMSMTREFMLTGKLHRAITFGMDVPSLLFADSTGKDCGWDESGSTANPLPSSNNVQLEDAVLEARLLKSKMLHECELDYNRVVGHGILRALLPRHEFSSMVVRSIMTEIMSGCVLTPIMSCFCPQSLNEWIIAGMDSLLNTAAATEPVSASVDTAASSNQPSDQSPSTARQNPPPASEDIKVQKRANQSTLTVDTETATNDIPAGIGDDRGSATQHMNLTNVPASAKMGNDMDESTRHYNAEVSDYARDTYDMDHHDDDDDEEETSASVTGDQILPLLAMSLIELQQFMDFDDCRDARRNQQQIEVNWDDPGYRAAVLQLVLIIEAGLLHGRRAEKVGESHDRPSSGSAGNGFEETEESIEMTLPEYQSMTLSQMLMEMTSDMEAFEKRVFEEEDRLSKLTNIKSPLSNRGTDLLESQHYKPSPSELSTLRTLIAAWLHTGLIHRVITLLIRSTATLLSPYYHMHAFLRDAGNAGAFARQLKGLDGVDILVDTISVLSSPSLDLYGANASPTKPTSTQPDSSESSAHLIAASTMSPTLLKTAFTKSMKQFTETNLHRFMINGSILTSTETAMPDELSPTSFMAQFAGPTVTPRFLDFQKNSAFATSLRSERERRLQSWAEATKKKDNDDGVHTVCVRKGASEDEIGRHRELHHLARTFYSATTLVGIRDGTRRKESADLDSQSGTSSQASGEATPISLLTVEMACARRRIEVPDDDSSFLLRAQPRPLSAVGVHRDQRNHEQSYKSFAATYEEPALRPGSSRFTGGRYIRQCLLRYYPSDRTASIVVQNDTRRIDQRKGRTVVPDSISIRNPSSNVLTNEFLRERHLCHKWNPKGSAPRSGSILASSVMEPTEFNSAPRSGKAFDFVYRVSLFESPMVELGGKRFTIHDSSVLGTHRADASALEMSDATLSAALAIMGRDWEFMTNDGAVPSVADPLVPPTDLEQRPLVELGPDGYPIVWMKFQRKQDDKTSVEIKPYRTSFVRAALLLTGARQEAQLQCLVSCVRAGSAKSATKALTESHLKPTVRLLEYAGSRSREMQSVLLRDLKFGINHIDRDQLRRNHLLHPRYPTSLRSLSVAVESALHAKDCGVHTLESPSTFVFKIRCVAMVELIDKADCEVDAAYVDGEGNYGGLYREEWVVFRSFKDFQALHKHLKTQVAASEASGNTGTRIAGALAAAGVSASHHRQRKALIPSLGSATKAGALGVTKKAISKRIEVLDGYLRHLLSPSHLLNQTPEILLFIGASHPFPREVGTDEPPFTPTRDLLGRVEMTRKIFKESPPPVHTSETPQMDSTDEASRLPPAPSRNVRTTSASSITLESVKDADGEEIDDESSAPKSRTKEEDMNPSIRARIDKVPLSQVRHCLFELVRYQFGFDNASFLRSRMLSALKTASFAVTTATEFRKTLYDMHVKLLNAESIADWIKLGLEALWPDGVFIQFSKPLSPEELQSLSDQAKQKLQEGFPDALRTILGQDLTKDGLEMMHEMFQNRVVVKSMAYMLFDLLWLEAFPELDVLTGGAALDMD